MGIVVLESLYFELDHRKDWKYLIVCENIEDLDKAAYCQADMTQDP